MKDGQYIHIEGWMGKRLQLRANELICFAVIYGFSMDGESQFKGNLIYLSECMFATQPTVLSSLKKLLECNLILKQDDVVKGKKRCYYSTNIIFENGGFIVVDTTKEPLVMTTKEPLVMTTKEPLVDTYYNKKDNNKEKRLSNDNQKNKRFIKPTVEDIQAYIDEKKLSFDAERFFDYYESKGWLVGKSPMKDWKAACRNWDSIRKREIKEEKKKTYDILPDDSDKCKRFKNWMRENHTEQENCLKPLSFDGYMRLQREYGKDEVCFQLDYIDANIGRFLQSDIEASIRLHFKREEQ